MAEEKRTEIAAKLSIFADRTDGTENGARELRFKQIKKQVTGYVKGKCDGKDCVALLFGEGREKEALNKFLKERFDCCTFALAKKYKEMLTMPVDSSIGFSGDLLLKTDKDLTDIVICAANDIVRSGLLTNIDLLAEKLRSTYHLECGEEFYDFSSYGRYRKPSPVCPVCGGKLLIETAVSKVGGILVGKENRVEFPLLMCMNCYSSLNYIKETNLQYCDTEGAESEYKVITADSFSDINRFFRSARFRLKIKFANVGKDGENVTKIVDLKMTFLHKVILYLKLISSAGT